LEWCLEILLKGRDFMVSGDCGKLEVTGQNSEKKKSHKEKKVSEMCTGVTLNLS
jgi:hypothetical protein